MFLCVSGGAEKAGVFMGGRQTGEENVAQGWAASRPLTTDHIQTWFHVLLDEGTPTAPNTPEPLHLCGNWLD